MRGIYWLPFIAIACGDNKGTEPTPDSSADTAPDAPQPVTCNYTEMNDANNDALFGGDNPEATNLMFGSTAIGLCGKIDVSHYENGRMLIDVDSYQINVPARTNAIIYATAPGGEALNTILIEIYSQTPGEDAVGKYIGTFAMASDTLPPGDYTVQISAFHTAAPAAPLDYKLVVAPDSPTRCAKSAAAAAYTETLDGATPDGNDIYEVRYSGGQQRRFTANASDMAEPTNITVAADMTYRISGQNQSASSPPPDWADFYQDRDTYQITMGATTNQLALRLNWPGTTADLDFLVFPMAQLNDFADGYADRAAEDEFETFAVAPGATYWVFVGADHTTTGQPIAYDLTVCGTAFTPL